MLQHICAIYPSMKPRISIIHLGKFQWIPAAPFPWHIGLYAHSVWVKSLFSYHTADTEQAETLDHAPIASHLHLGPQWVCKWRQIRETGRVGDIGLRSHSLSSPEVHSAPQASTSLMSQAKHEDTWDLHCVIKIGVEWVQWGWLWGPLGLVRTLLQRSRLPHWEATLIREFAIIMSP